MEIHTPDHPLKGWKETANHLAIVTVGVLIALTLEGIVSWADHRLLVREAVANLTAELRDNKKELERLLPSLAVEEQQLEQADKVARVLAKGPAPAEQWSIESHNAELKNAAVTTGQITGAFGYMNYGQVRRYADVYDLQAQYMRLEEREGQHFNDVLSFIRRVYDAERPNADAIERWKGQIDIALAGVYAREQRGRQLLARYDQILAVK